MKKIFLCLAAAVVAFASCVEEQGLEPVGDVVLSGNEVTIKAVTGETKTTVNGTVVKWEANDVIAVVLDKDLAEFTVKGQPDGASATFAGAIESKDYETAYAVYPATAYSYDPATTTVTLNHTLPEVQTGVVTTGMNLASAALSADDLMAGSAEATFHNALTLLKVSVPAGVKQVKFSVPHSKPALVGDAKVTVNTFNGTAVVSGAKGYEVTLATGTELVSTVTYNLLVYPANKTDLTLTMEGTDGTVYTSRVEGVELKASTYKTIDLSKIFKMETKETMNISPAGGELVVPIYATADYEYSVSGCPSWLSYSVPTKGFHGEKIIFSADANQTGAERSADVTISWGENNTRTFKVKQAVLFMDFVNDENGDPIQWAETFSVYATKEDALAGTNPTTYKNVFTIALSDDFTKGAYKISGMFAFNNVYDSPVIPTYYANYVDGKLTVIQNQDGFYFQSDITFAYDAEAKTFIMTDPVAVGSRFDIPGWQSKSGWIYGYNAAVKVEEEPEPETPGEGEEEGGFDAASLEGTYSETFNTFMGLSTGTMTITVSGSDITVAMLDGACNCSAILNDDGETLTVKSDGIGYNGSPDDPFSGDLILEVGEVEGKVTLKLSSSMKLWSMTFLTSYTATMN